MLTYQNWLFAGSEGWLDNVGYFRLKDYIADKNGYRILKSKTVYIGKGHTMKVMFCQFCSNFIKLHSTFVYICIYHFKFIEITANICKNFTNSNITIELKLKIYFQEVLRIANGKQPEWVPEPRPAPYVSLSPKSRPPISYIPPNIESNIPTYPYQKLCSSPRPFSSPEVPPFHSQTPSQQLLPPLNFLSYH